VERGTVTVKHLALPRVDTTQCPRPGLEPGLLVPESSALTMRPPHLPPLSLTGFEYIFAL